MRTKILSFLRPRLLLGEHIVVALSGGKDSMALLHALWNLQKELSITVSAAHFNHGLRGIESQRDEKFVQSWCASQGIPLEIGHFDVRSYANRQGLSIETAAREKRYEFLLSLPGKIVTAHTAEDNLETLLMHLLRGSGLHGLTGIPPEHGNLLRPMLDVTHSEVESYLLEYAIPHIEDSTNKDDTCLRNRLRHHVLPLLEQENSKAAVSISHLCQILRTEDNYLEAQAQNTLAHLLQGGLLDICGFLALPEALQNRVMALFLQEVPQLQRTHVEGAIRLCRSASPSAVLSLPGLWTLRRAYTQLSLSSPSAPPDAPLPIPIAVGQTLQFGPWCVACRRSGEFDKSVKFNALALDAKKISGVMMLRTRRSGDRISIPGGTKKVSRLLIDEKIPAVWRETIPLLCCGENILAVLPLRVADCYRAASGQDRLLLSATRTEESI